MKTLILGASGNVGSQLAPLLKKKGHQVHLATSRQSNNNNNEQVHLNLVTQKGIDEALENVDSAFLLSPAGYTNQEELLSPIIKKAKEKGLKKIVLMTAMGVNNSPEAPLRQAEIELETSGLNYNIIRPNWFMQNFHTFWLAGIKQAQTIFLPTGNAKGSFIDTGDIASVAAELLTRDEFNNKDFDLTGSEAFNHSEIAEILSDVTGKQIKYEDISPGVMRENLIGAGLSADYADFLGLILNAFKQGYASKITSAIEDITGQKPLTFKAYAHAHKSKWL